jgi:O-antigen/teichoic acid export membrane protein
MLPVYTRALPPSEYGALGVLLSLAAGVGFLFAAGVETSIIRNYFQLASEPERRQEYFASIWRFLVLYPIVGSLVLTAVAWLTGPRSSAHPR